MSDLFLERIGVTLRLTILAILIETIVGITLGVLAGLRKDKFLDNFGQGVHLGPGRRSRPSCSAR